LRLGLVVDPGDPRIPGAIEITHDMPVRGVATSGRHGRSFSLGIADSVTVLGATAAIADAAATLIANAVDLPHQFRRQRQHYLLGGLAVEGCVGYVCREVAVPGFLLALLELGFLPGRQVDLDLNGFAIRCLFWGSAAPVLGSCCCFGFHVDTCYCFYMV
jgi:hypothetical protein